MSIDKMEKIEEQNTTEKCIVATCNEKATQQTTIDYLEIDLCVVFCDKHAKEIVTAQIDAFDIEDVDTGDIDDPYTKENYEELIATKDQGQDQPIEDILQTLRNNEEKPESTNKKQIS